MVYIYIQYILIHTQNELTTPQPTCPFRIASMLKYNWNGLTKCSCCRCGNKKAHEFHWHENISIVTPDNYKLC